MPDILPDLNNIGKEKNTQAKAIETIIMKNPINWKHIILALCIGFFCGFCFLGLLLLIIKTVIT